MEKEIAAKIILVRAVEEKLPQRITPDMLLEARIAAGDPLEGESWIARRALYLAEHALSHYVKLLSCLELTYPGKWLLIILAILLGLGTNYLGPGTKIHVLWNPIVLLISWNIFIYAALAIAFISRRSRVTDQITTEVTRLGYHPGFIERYLLGPAISKLLLKEGAEEVGEQKSDIEPVIKRFAVLWLPAVRPRLRFEIRRALHLCAIGLAAGALWGMYVRGLFFEYDVVWQSTFIRDPQVVAAMLRYLLGPAALVLNYPLPDAEAVTRMLSAKGDPAAQWIHLYAVSAFLFIVVPRVFLTVAVSSQLRRANRIFKLDLNDEYFQNLLEAAKNISPEEIEKRTRAVVQDECRQFITRLEEFILKNLYDHRIMRQLWNYRDKGGSLRHLEEVLTQEVQFFKPELESEMMSLKRNLEHGLALGVQRLFGEDRPVLIRSSDELADQITSESSHAMFHTGECISGDITKVVAGVVSASVAAVVGTLSGGFGEVIGTAFLIGLVETGPVGWIIGAVGGLVAAGAGYYYGREKLKQNLKKIDFPTSVLKTIIWSSRYEKLIAKGRAECEQAVKNSLESQVDQLASQIADKVYKGLQPLVGERQRPHIEREEYLT